MLCLQQKTVRTRTLEFLREPFSGVWLGSPGFLSVRQIADGVDASVSQARRTLARMAAKNEVRATGGSMKRLSNRAQTLLRLIASRSDVDWTTGSVSGYWIPQAKSEYLLLGHGFPLEEVYVSGPGDAAALRCLETRGLTRRPSGAAVKFAYVITEDGLLESDRIENGMRAEQ